MFCLLYFFLVRFSNYSFLNYNYSAPCIVLWIFFILLCIFYKRFIELVIRDMSHLLLFGLQVEEVVRVGFNLDGDTLHDLDAVTGQTDEFQWIVGH